MSSRLSQFCFAAVFVFATACKEKQIITEFVDRVVTDTTGNALIDSDGDKAPDAVDCEPNNPNVSPLADEIYYDGIDNDCYAGTADDDQDSDGYTAAATDDTSNGADCNDLNPNINPGAMELDDGIDSDCDGDALELAKFDRDDDGFTSGYGSATLAKADCNDSDAQVNPGLKEISSDGKDNDCNSMTLDDDADGDGESANIDCDDHNANINHSASEVYYNGLDDDCSMVTDDGDQDNDGYTITSMGGDDCDDTNANRHPGMVDIPGNAIDDDCSGGDAVASAANGVYVAKTGADTGACGSVGSPCLTIQYAADKAYGEGKSAVYIAAGTYSESVATRVSLIGGYNAGFTTLNPTANKTYINYNSTSGNALEILANSSVQVYGLTITATSTDSHLNAVVAGSNANLRFASSEITLSVNSANNSLNLRAFDVSDAGKIHIHNTQIKLNDFSASGSKYFYAFYASPVQKLIIRGGSVTGNDFVSGANTSNITVIYLDGGYANMQNTATNLQTFGGRWRNFTGAESEAGTLLFNNNTFTLGGGDVLERVQYFVYQDDGWVVAANNSLSLGGLSSGQMQSFDSLAYNSGYGRLSFIDNQITSNGAVNGGDIAYGYYGAYVFMGNTIDFFLLTLDTMFQAGYGGALIANNTYRFDYLPSPNLELYYLYEGHTIIEGEDFYAGVISNSTYWLYNYYSRIEVSDSRFVVGEYQSRFEGYFEGGAAYLDNVYFEAITVAGSSTSYLFDIYQYGGVEVANSLFSIGTVADSASIYYVYNEYALNNFSNNSFEIDHWNSSGTLYIYEGDYASIDSRNESFVVGRASDGDIFPLYSDYGGAYLDGLYMDIGAGFNDNFGFDGYRAGTIIKNSQIQFGGVDNQVYGFTTRSDYGSLWVDSSILTVNDFADEVFLIYQYDSDVAIVNSVVANYAAVTNIVYGVYGDCCGSVEFIHSYMQAGGGAGGNANATYNWAYSSDYISYIFINSIFAMDVTNGSRYGFDFDDSPVSYVMRNNIFKDAHNLVDYFIASNSDGYMTYATASTCSNSECGEFIGNQVANPQLVNPAGGDYHLKAGSPAINAGGSTAPFFEGVYRDFEGDARKNRPDIGPDERQ